MSQAEMLPGTPPAGKCSGCAALRKRIEDLEGALEGAHNIIRQHRDIDSKLGALKTAEKVLRELQGMESGADGTRGAG